MSTTIKSTTTILFNRIPSTICTGFTDVQGRWNDGFVCPIENLIQYFCCGTDTYRYCCSPDRYSFESHSYIDSNRTYDSLKTYNDILTDEIDTSLLNHQKLIRKQFEQFQRYFLPIFILTTTILLLVGIAIWFWLYKHKTFYSLGQDECIPSRSSYQTNTNSIDRRRENQSHSTEV